MAYSKIDYSKSGQKKTVQKFNKNQLLRKLANISNKDVANLTRLLYDDKARYDEKTVNKSNELLSLLKDNGIDYDLIARSDGGGILAKVKGLAGNHIIITIAVKDDYAFNKAKGSYEMRSGVYNVGNIVANGYSFYIDGKTELQKATLKYIKDNNIKKDSSEWKKAWAKVYNDERFKDFNDNKMTYLIKGLTGKLPVRPIFNKGSQRTDNNFDHAYTIVDDSERPIVKFYRKKEKIIENELPFFEKYLEMSKEDNATLESTPLKQMIKEINQIIENEKDANNMIEHSQNGILSRNIYEPISVENEAFDGLNLDTLLNFYNRKDIAKVIAYEMRNNDKFTLENTEIIGEPGLKDLLMEETAGVNADKVKPEDLGTSDFQIRYYQEIINYTKEILEKQGLREVEVNFDADYVLHWQGKSSYYSKSDKSIVDLARQGEIGQIFLPDEDGLVNTHFKTMKDSTDRNYHMVMGYVGYYKSNDKETTIKANTVKIQDNKNNVYEVVATKNNNGDLVPYITPKGTYIRPELLPEDKLVSFNQKVLDYNRKHPDKELPTVAIKEEKRTLRDRLRFKGYDQSLKQHIDSLISKQVLQEDNYSYDNTSLNRLYHGDVYGIRIQDQNLNKKNIVKTYQNRVKFDDSVLNLSMEELDANYNPDDEFENDTEDSSHRFNIRELDGIFDRSLSSDGANLGLVRYLNKGNKILSTGEVVPSVEGISGNALIKDDLPFTEGDPGDRSMMAGNQYMKARHVGLANVAYITYKGYTFEDGSVISEKFAREQGAIVNGYDEDGNPIPLEIGDKISDLHGNKSTISYIASEKDDVFKENPNLDVIMNPHSVSTRLNTGLVLEMQSTGVEESIIHNGERIASAAPLNIVITDITAKGKTQTYDDKYDDNGDLIATSVKKGRSFGNQLAWVATGLELNHTMREIYGQNIKPFDKLRSYLNVTGLDIDEDTTIIVSNGFNNGKNLPPEYVKKIELKENIELPEEGGYIELPLEINLPSGMKTKYLNVLPENYRNVQELYDGQLLHHEYSMHYSKIAQSALVYDEINNKYIVKLQNKFEDLATQDLSQLNLNDEEQKRRLRAQLTNEEDVKEFDKYIGNLNKEQDQQEKKLQSNIDALTSKIIDEHLGGRSNLLERLDKYGDSVLSRSKNTNAIKKSIIKREIMSKEVPNSVSSVVTACPNVDINTIKVSPDIYHKLDLVDENDRVLLWRDPALHDGSMRAFKVELDKGIVGVGINPLVTESFGMDFDGDTVGVYAPRTREAQQEIFEKASIEKNLLDKTTDEFCGNIGMDFVSSAYKQGYVRDNNNFITQGPLIGREDEIKIDKHTWMNPKEQLQMMLNELAKEVDGAEKINDLWKKIVTSKHNIASSKIEFKDRESFKESLMHMAIIGAKGKPDNIVNNVVEMNMKEFEARHLRPITYLERMNKPDLYLSNQSTVMDYYDRGKEMCEHKAKFNNDPDGSHKKAYNMLYNPYKKVKMKNGEEKIERNIGSLGYDQDKTRMAQSGKTDLTGLAGIKSQMLVSLMYDQKNGAIAAMEVTEPLTQATLKLKHDPNKTPEIKKLLTDFDEMLTNGGYLEDEFVKDFKSMYNHVGLNVKEEHLKEVFNTLSKDDSQGVARTQPVQEVIEEKMSPLMKANLYGFDALKECATGIEKNVQIDKTQYVNRVLNEKGKWIDKTTQNNQRFEFGNMKILKEMSLGQYDKVDNKLRTLKNGNNISLHIPEDLKEVTISSRKLLAEQYAKENNFGIYENKREDKTKDVVLNNKSTKNMNADLYSKMPENVKKKQDNINLQYGQ
ncbi:hypothetical protein [Staphylococcus aureus]|uniref:hypothetical protein n=1 Tax=Staphylococcus aureus TaxID=1280 RepID=UPI001CE0BD8E|nr:hypothetical protein [Staphylococcus aureus]MCA1235791.1 hypothetical protein [Staphylococcus aureus]